MKAKTNQSEHEAHVGACESIKVAENSHRWMIVSAYIDPQTRAIAVRRDGWCFPKADFRGVLRELKEQLDADLANDTLPEEPLPLAPGFMQGVASRAARARALPGLEEVTEDIIRDSTVLGDMLITAEAALPEEVQELDAEEEGDKEQGGQV